MVKPISFKDKKKAVYQVANGFEDY